MAAFAQCRLSEKPIAKLPVRFRPVSAATEDAYRTLLTAGLSRSAEEAATAAFDAGCLAEAAVRRYKELVEHQVGIIVTVASREEPFDFADRSLVAVICDQAASMASDRETWHIPLTATLFVQRKVSGMALLAARLEARGNVRSPIEAHVSRSRVGI